MNKKAYWLIFALVPVMLLSGCGISKKAALESDAIITNNEAAQKDLSSSENKTNNRKVVTEIVYQEPKIIIDLQDFAQEAQKLAIEKIGPDAKLKRIEFKYLSDENYIAYIAIFLSNEKFSNDVPKNLFVTYNEKYEIKDNPYSLEFSGHENEADNNGELIGMQCSLDKSCESMIAYSKFDDIKIDDLQISLVDLVKNYQNIKESSFGKFGTIFVYNNILKGVYVNYRFKPATREVALSDDIDEAKWFGYSSTSTSIALTINKLDSDEDGLLDNDEINIYKTDPKKSDTDGDGYRDGDEIKSGYNPLGAGKLIEKNVNQTVSPPASISKEKLVVVPETKSSASANSACLTDECYGDLAITKKDNSICNSIKDHALRGQCLFGVAYKSGNMNPCEVLGDSYPELDTECKELNDEIKQAQQPINRDAVTLADIKQLQVALELYYNDAGKYPENIITGNPIAFGGNTYIAKVPSAKEGKMEICFTNYQYKYTYINNENYSLTYCLDQDTNGISLGAHIASPKGIK